MGEWDRHFMYMDNIRDEAEELVESVLLWWEDAQYWEDPPGRNRFDDEPEFVKKARVVQDAIKGGD